MMTDRFFLYPTHSAANDHCAYLKGQFCYRYQLVYTGRRSFLDILHGETAYQQTSSLLGMCVCIKKKKKKKGVCMSYPSLHYFCYNFYH